HPSLGLSWVARDTDGAVLNVLALRAAYGSAGRGLPSFLPIVFVPVGTPVRCVDLAQTTSVELGTDASLMGRRLNAELTYYDMRSDFLEHPDLSTPSGYYQIYSSGGVISNRGIEAVLFGKVLASPRIAWDVSLSLWGNRNRLLKFDSAQQCFDPVDWQCLRAGYPVGGYWTFPITYADSNGDGIIAGREVDRVPQPQWAGTPYPTQGAMLTSGWTLGNTFRLSATLDYRAGQTLFNADAWWRCAHGTCRQLNDHRTPLAQQAEALVAPSGATPMFFEDADFLKLRELAFTYFAPPGVAAALRARTDHEGRMNLLRRKSVTELQTEALTDHSLKRALGALNLTMLGIGAIIGTGIFVLTGTVAALNAGPAVVLSFTLAGVASIFAA